MFLFDLNSTNIPIPEPTRSPAIIEPKLIKFELLNLHLSEDDIKFWKESKIDDSCNNLVHGDLNPRNNSSCVWPMWLMLQSWW